ncbi:MAG: hypothetical protein K2M50_06445 [Treponemataceae bacterium]|nr:hypothetical protein [Treponemataceae bacterium]
MSRIEGKFVEKAKKNEGIYKEAKLTKEMKIEYDKKIGGGKTIWEKRLL